MILPINEFRLNLYKVIMLFSTGICLKLESFSEKLRYLIFTL